MYLKKEDQFQCLKGAVFAILQSKCTVSFGNQTVLKHGDTILGAPVIHKAKLYGYNVRTQMGDIYLSARVGPQCVKVGSIKIKEAK